MPPPEERYVGLRAVIATVLGIAIMLLLIWRDL
jgi:hypothetical protein